MKSLADNLKAARKASGLNQADVAAACGWDTPSRYANYEQGTREPTLADLRLIAKAVESGGYSFAKIVTGEDLVPAFQSGRLSAETIADAVRLVTGANATMALPAFEIETLEDAELFALAIEHVLDDDIHGASDSDVQRFARKLGLSSEKKDGKVGTPGSHGRADRAASSKEAREKSRSATGRTRKSA